MENQKTYGKSEYELKMLDIINLIIELRAKGYYPGMFIADDKFYDEEPETPYTVGFYAVNNNGTEYLIYGYRTPDRFVAHDFGKRNSQIGFLNFFKEDLATNEGWDLINELDELLRNLKSDAEVELS